MTGALSQKVAYKNKLLIVGALADFILLKIIYKLSIYRSKKAFEHLPIFYNITHVF